MKKEFSISNDKVLMNFSARYCTNFEGLLESEESFKCLFKEVRKEKNIII